MGVQGGQGHCKRLARDYLFPLKDMEAWLEVAMKRGSRRR